MKSPFVIDVKISAAVPEIARVAIEIMEGANTAPIATDRFSKSMRAIGL
jgi:hypothetical protein